MQCLGGASKGKSVVSLPLSFFMLDKMLAMGWKPYIDAWTPGNFEEQSFTISLDFYGKERSFELFKPLFVLIVLVVCLNLTEALRDIQFLVNHSSYRTFLLKIIFCLLRTFHTAVTSHSSLPAGQPKSTPALS